MIFGPKYHKFPEAVALTLQGGAFSIKSTDALNEVFKQLEDPVFYQKASKQALNYLTVHRGATQRIMDEICN